MPPPDQEKTNGPRFSSGVLLAVRLLLVAFVAALIISRVPLDRAWQAVRDAQLPFIAAAMAFIFLSRLAFTLRWHFLLVASGVRHPYIHTLGLTLIALFYEKAGPGTIVGDGTKAYLASDRHDVELGEAAASVAADRVVGLISLAALGLPVSILIRLPRLQTTLLLFLAFYIVVGGVGSGALAWMGGVSTEERNSQRLCRRALVWVAVKAQELIRGFRLCARDRTSIILAVLASCVANCLMAVAFQSWCRAVGSQLAFSPALAIVLLSSMIGMLPITLNGLVVTEGAQTLLLAWTGMPEASGLAIAVMHRLTKSAIALTGVGAQFVRDRSGGEMHKKTNPQ